MSKKQGIPIPLEPVWDCCNWLSCFRAEKRRPYKPLDEAAIQEAARSCGALVTAEEHQLAGGLFGAVSEVVVRTCPVPMEAVAVQDTFGESGPPEALMVRYGLNADAIAQAVRRCLARKG